MSPLVGPVQGFRYLRMIGLVNAAFPSSDAHVTSVYRPARYLVELLFEQFNGAVTIDALSRLRAILRAPMLNVEQLGEKA